MNLWSRGSHNRDQSILFILNDFWVTNYNFLENLLYICISLKLSLIVITIVLINYKKVQSYIIIFFKVKKQIGVLPIFL